MHTIEVKAWIETDIKNLKALMATFENCDINVVTSPLLTGKRRAQIQIIGDSQLLINVVHALDREGFL